MNDQWMQGFGKGLQTAIDELEKYNNNNRLKALLDHLNGIKKTHSLLMEAGGAEKMKTLSVELTRDEIGLILEYLLHGVIKYTLSADVCVIYPQKGTTEGDLYQKLMGVSKSLPFS